MPSCRRRLAAIAYRVVVTVVSSWPCQTTVALGKHLFHARPVIASFIHANLRQIQATATCIANDKLRQHASSLPTQPRTAQTPAAAQHPANAATTTTPAIAIGRSDGCDATTTGQPVPTDPSTDHDDQAMPVDDDSDNGSMPVDYDNGSIPVDLRRWGDGQRQGTTATRRRRNEATHHNGPTTTTQTRLRREKSG
ncbi:hypothetical protein EDB89DRAFT_1910656 [Lactarius sanguifluus]|nr:hypothetical protein EDB89DRAFT_1913051 [Lactarius sanguifluus]KAH9166527.1 hypothetical protein EDB89DRAFT_1910656 [Lactarius sanguifluus]